MSIEYFVEGKITSQTEGNQTFLSKGNIVHNSIQNIRQKGSDTGLSYNQPNEINPYDKPVNTINVSLDLFFDGTQNNKTNTESGKDNAVSNGKDSYANDYSNVARAFDAADTNSSKQAVVYIEGIGTVDGKRDTNKYYSDYPNNIGSPLGMGDRGIEAKVTKGCMEGAEALAKKFSGKTIDILKINVYGFSRGAGAARHFVHIATSPANAVAVSNNKYLIIPSKKYERSEVDEETRKKDGNSDQSIEVKDLSDPLIISHGYFGACLVKNKVHVNRIVFNFVGVYDTVASFGINHKGFGIFVKSDAEQLHLNAINKASFTLQISSADEYRENFSLTDISSTGINGLEFTLPGVHSDIGGSYFDGAIEESNLYNGSLEDCEKMRDILEEEGWFKKEQLKIFKIDKTFLKLNYSSTHELRGTRKLSNHYDRIPLTVMFHYSKQFDVEYLDTTIARKHAISDVNIKNVYSHLVTYMNKCHQCRTDNNTGESYRKQLNNLSYLSEMSGNTELLKTLRNQYLHWSVNIGSDPDSTGMGPHVSAVTTFDKRKRYIIPG